jgi:hypothetical protein
MITHSVSELVVQGFKIVQVDHHQAQRVVITLGPVELLFDPLADIGFTKQSRQALPDDQTVHLLTNGQPAQAYQQDDEHTDLQNRAAQRLEADLLPILGDEVRQGTVDKVGHGNNNYGPEPFSQTFRDNGKSSIHATAFPYSLSILQERLNKGNNRQG